MTNQSAVARGELAGRSNSAIEASKQTLFDLSKDVHAHPELNYEEFYSSDALVRFLEGHDLTVERGVGGIETAFRATIPGGGAEGRPSPCWRNTTHCPKSATAAGTT